MIFDDINNQISNFKGHVGYYYYNLNDNYDYGYNENDLFLAASVIKFPIYCVICKLVSENKLSFKEKIDVKEKDKLPSCGALNAITGEFSIDIESLCNLMIRISDNSATNLLIKRLGIDFLNEQFKQIGLIQTHLERVLFDSESSKKGFENRICLKELGQLLKEIYNEEFVNPDVSKYILDCLLKQQINHKIPGYLNDSVDVAHKTGEDDNLSNDIGIVLTKKPFVICFAGHDVNVKEWEIFIRETSEKLVSEFNR